MERLELGNRGRSSFLGQYLLKSSNGGCGLKIMFFNYNLQRMSEQRRNQILQQFRRPTGNKSSRSKDVKGRFQHMRSKETFLTDTQTSDYTKSSGQINISRVQKYQETIRKLQKENNQLKQKVIELKKNQFFQINEEKLKSIIKQNDKLRHELDKIKKDLEESMVERDFLQRFNRNLKTQCQNLTKEILILKGNSTQSSSKRYQSNIYTARNQNETSRNKNTSHQHSSSLKKQQEFLYWKKEKQEKASQNSGTTLKNSLSASGLHDDYYPGRSSRNKAYKHM